MSDDENDTNAQYYSALWTKVIKPRSQSKRLKHKRVSKKMMRLGDVSIRTIEHLLRLHHKREHPRKCPLRR